MKGVDWSGFKSDTGTRMILGQRTQFIYQVPVFAKISPISAPSCDVLRASKIYVDGIRIRFDNFG